MAYQDLRDFIRALEKEGELKRIPFEVDPHLEITEFADRSVKKGKSRSRRECAPAPRPDLKKAIGVAHETSHEPPVARDAGRDAHADNFGVPAEMRDSERERGQRSYGRVAAPRLELRSSQSSTSLRPKGASASAFA